MKTLTRVLIGAMVLACFIACQKDRSGNTILSTPVVTSGEFPTGQKGTPGPCNPNAYTITLESRVFNGINWEWVWSVQNPNPGNGSNGTVQNLSHWGMQFGSCFNWSTVVSAAYSADGINWTGFIPSLAPDPSQSCLMTAVLKFDYGTTGSAKTYYQLVLSENYPPGTAAGYYKSGTNTGCCTFTFVGVGCTGGPTEERSGK